MESRPDSRRTDGKPAVPIMERAFRLFAQPRNRSDYHFTPIRGELGAKGPIDAHLYMRPNGRGAGVPQVWGRRRGASVRGFGPARRTARVRVKLQNDYL